MGRRTHALFSTAATIAMVSFPPRSRGVDVCSMVERSDPSVKAVSSAEQEQQTLDLLERAGEIRSAFEVSLNGHLQDTKLPRLLCSYKIEVTNRRLLSE